MFDPTPYRQLFPITERCIFLNHAGISPLNTRAVEAMNAFNEQVSRLPFSECMSTIADITTGLKNRLATLINARSTDEIVLMHNTAMGINTAALSLPLRAGDNVLVIDGDYPANIYPWMNLVRRGVLTKFVPTRDGGADLDLLVSRMDSHTRAVALSTVQFATGFRNDVVAIGKLCRERNLYFVVDGIQSLGALPFDVQAAQVDFLCSGSQKWLLGPVGAGFMYVRRERLDELVPGPYVGAASVVDAANFLDYNFTLQPTAERFSIGSSNLVGFAGLNASVALIQEVGIDQIGNQVLRLVDIILSDLQERGYHFSASVEVDRRSGIVIVEVDQPAATCQRLAKEGISTVMRGKGVRIAPHFYNTEEELRRVAEVLDQRS